MKTVLVLAGMVLGTGCAYKATLHTDPIGASLYVDNELVGIAPYDVTVRAFSGPRQVRVELPGYRPYEVHFGTERRLLPRLRFALVHPAVVLGRKPPPERLLLLIPEHGPAGTWTPEDVER